MPIEESHQYKDLSKVWEKYIKKYMDKGCSEIKANMIACKMMKRKGII